MWLWMVGVPLEASAGVAPPECYPLATAIGALAENGTLDEPVFVEEWSTCVGESRGGPLAVELPDGDHGDTQGILEALLATYNVGGGLDYEVTRLEPGWSVAPVGRPRCASALVEPADGVESLADLEVRMLRSFQEHCGVTIMGPALGRIDLGRTEAPSMDGQTPAATVLSREMAHLRDTPVGWVLGVYPSSRDSSRRYVQEWSFLYIREPPGPSPLADLQPLPPGVKGRLTDPDGRVRDVLEDGTIVEVRGPDPDRKETVEPSP